MPATRSMEDDFMCIVNTYLPRYKANERNLSAENNIDCPLGELGLVAVVNPKKKTYRKATPAVELLNPWVMLAIIVEQAGASKEVSLNDLLLKEGNIGRIFNLDAVALLELLHKIELLHEVQVIRTAGLDVVRILNKRSFMECVENYYKDIEE